MIRAKKPTFREQIEGFPIAQVIVIACVRLAEPIAFTSLFPYVYFMVQDFNIAKNESEISTYAGYLASSFAFCQVLSAIHWGKAADKYGRKRVLMCGLFGCSISLLMLGFSKNFWMALFARSLMGLLNGNSAVVRCVVGEIAVRRKHQSLAFLVMPVVWNIGGVFGPWIGGTLSLPRSIEANAMNKSYPYALPNIVIAAILLVGIMVTYLFLEETHPSLRHEYDRGLDIGDRILIGAGVYKKVHRKWEIEAENEEDETMVLLPALTEKAGWKEILRPKVINPIIAYFIMQAHFVVFNEFLPIFVSYDAAYDDHGMRKSRFPLNLIGGLGYTAKKAGNLLSSSGMFGIIMMLTIFPWIDRTFSPIGHFRFALAMFPILFFALPYIVLLLPKQIDGVLDTNLADCVLYGFVFIRVVIASTMSPTVMVLINENAPPGAAGLVNGLSISASSLAACVAPLVWGRLMSYSQKIEAGWLSWWSLSALTFFGLIQGFFVKEGRK